jgi:hypothetical protein
MKHFTKVSFRQDYSKLWVGCSELTNEGKRGVYCADVWRVWRGQRLPALSHASSTVFIRLSQSTFTKQGSYPLLPTITRSRCRLTGVKRKTLAARRFSYA